MGQDRPEKKYGATKYRMAPGTPRPPIPHPGPGTGHQPEHKSARLEHERLFGQKAKTSGDIGLTRILKNPTQTAWDARPKSKDFGRDVNLPRTPARKISR